VEGGGPGDVCTWGSGLLSGCDLSCSIPPPDSRAASAIVYGSPIGELPDDVAERTRVGGCGVWPGLGLSWGQDQKAGALTQKPSGIS